MNGNQKNTLRFIAVFLILLLAAGCAVSFAPNAPVKTAPVPVTVLFFNDLHGFLEPFDIEDKAGKQEVGGIARMATLVREIRLENDRRQVQTVLLIAGDILQGTLMSTVFQGEPDMEVFNAMGVDALTVGNHEFDFGLANFHKLKGKAAFPFLSANILE
ncbi:MAG: metallophosphoesterase, partial [Syntrophaceae bacterium]|nr:metallophosphoesterase [Syntrophaceae bacterium]